MRLAWVHTDAGANKQEQNKHGCGPIAVAIALDVSFGYAKSLVDLAKQSNPTEWMRTILLEHGWTWVPLDDAPLDSELPYGKMLVLVKEPWHYTVVWDHIIHDVYDLYAHGDRKILGYYEHSSSH